MQNAYVPIWNKLPKNATKFKFAFDFGHFAQPISINWNDQTTLWGNKCSIEIENNYILIVQCLLSVWPGLNNRHEPKIKNILIPPHARLKTKASGQTSGHYWLHECRLGREWQSYKYMYLKYIQWMYMHCNKFAIILLRLIYKTTNKCDSWKNMICTQLDNARG